MEQLDVILTNQTMDFGLQHPDWIIGCNISKTCASGFIGVSKHKKTDEAVGLVLLLFSSVWKTPMKQEAQVFEITSPTKEN